MSFYDKSQNLYFSSKRDWWVVGLIWMGLVISVVGGIVPLVVSETTWGELVFVLGLILGMDSLMLWVLYGTGYTVTQDQLLIRCGPFGFRMRLDAIDSITPTRSPWSSPACSLDRLKIVYGVSQQSVMISPVEKSGFLSAIVQQCPTLIVVHDGIRKKTDSPSSVGLDPTVQPQVLA
jgi:hypothetical protein